MPIDTAHADYTKMLPKWERCSDAADGQDAVHAAGPKYLPKLTDQSDADYAAYKQRACFYNATWRTISGLLGMILRVPPVVSVPDTYMPLLDDVDLAGTDITTFINHVLEESLETGRSGVLVDSPQLAESVATRADAALNGARPMMQMYDAEAIINWRTGSIQNRQQLTLVVLKEEAAVQKDEWETGSETRWRELALVDGVYRVRVFRRSAGNPQAFEQIGDDIWPTVAGQRINYIPFVFIGVDELTPEVDDPPLIDLVDLNLAHYRVTADYEHGCHFTGLPTAIITGYTKATPDEKLYVGSTSAMIFPDPATSASFLEFSGQGLSTLVENLNRKEQQMAILGARMLEPQRKSVEAADTASIHRKGEESLLATIAQTVGRGVERALGWMIEWAGGAHAEVAVELNRDFYPVPMTGQTLTAIMGAWQAGMPGFSDQEVFAKLQRGGMISGGTTLEEEQARILNRQIELSNINLGA
jgi:hypothetical protein